MRGDIPWWFRPSGLGVTSTQPQFSLGSNRPVRLKTSSSPGYIVTVIRPHNQKNPFFVVLYNNQYLIMCYHNNNYNTYIFDMDNRSRISGAWPRKARGRPEENCNNM